VRALQYREKKGAKRPSAVLRREPFDDIIGGSPQMKACMDLLAQAAHSDAAVLITGETGTGKELFARAIHDNSFRASKSFVVVDCTALPKTLVESMLFGYEKGAFTGADRARDGLIKQANGGTLFLDEVAELPLSVQKAFLRVLQEGRFRPLGSRQELASDFRVVAASNRDLDARVRGRRFRKDLLFRLRSFSIELPPVRERPEDIRELVEYYMGELCERYGMGAKEFSPGFLDRIAQYSWPGNVRELIHAVERALSAGRHEPVLFPKHLPTYIRVDIARASVEKEAAAKASPRAGGAPSQGLSRLQDVREVAIAEVEEQYLRELVSATGGNIKEACQLSGLSRSRLYALLKKYDLSTVG
jgi:two-component system NtrC family response regulator